MLFISVSILIPTCMYIIRCGFVSVPASDGFYIILKGVARYQPKVWNGLNEKRDSAVSYNPLTSSSLAMLENFRSSDVSDVYARSPDSKVRDTVCFFHKQQTT